MRDQVERHARTDGLYQDTVERIVREAGGLQFEHFHVDDAAVGRVYRDGRTLTPDQGGKTKTREMVQAVLAAYRNA